MRRVKGRSRWFWLWYWLVAGVLILVLTLWACRQKAHGSLAECIAATCRVTASDGRTGTGCVFEISEGSEGQVYVLTAAHVVGRHQTVQCEFWRAGYQSRAISGRVIDRVENGECDAAVIALRQSDFGANLPEVVPVAPVGYVMRPGATLLSVGCARGAWSTAWQGHVLETDDTEVLFTPTPADGRSGSAIFDAEGTQIVGIVRSRAGDGSHGIATCLRSLHRWLGRGQRGRPDRLLPNRPPKDCPPGGCPSPSDRPWLPPNQPRGAEAPPEEDQLAPTFPPTPRGPLVPVVPRPKPRPKPPANLIPPAIPGGFPSIPVPGPDTERLKDIVTRLDSVDEMLGAFAMSTARMAETDAYVRGEGLKAAAKEAVRTLAAERGPSIAAKWLPGLLTALGFSAPPSLAVLLGLGAMRFCCRARRRRRRRKGRRRSIPASSIDAGDDPPANLNGSTGLGRSADTVPQPPSVGLAEGQRGKLPHLPVDYAKIWADHYEHSGGNVRHEAIKNQLYQEAIGRLREGKIQTRANGGATADALDDWVLREFYRRVSLGPIPDENIYHQALMGFLYRSAVEKLRCGEIEQLGGRETADAIDSWVQREFVKRIELSTSSDERTKEK